MRARRLPSAVRVAIVKHARAAAPLECCGFLIGAAGRVQFSMPMPNVAIRPQVRYRIGNRQHIEVRRWLRRFSPPVEIVGIYHSHPHGAAYPSEADRNEAHYPDWLFVIVGLNSRKPTVRAFRIAGGRVRSV